MDNNIILPKKIKQHTVTTPYNVGKVHFYSIDTPKGFCLIDCGSPTQNTKDYIDSHFDLSKLEMIFLTHTHMDHTGALKHLLSKSNAKVFISQTDANIINRSEERHKGITKICMDYGIPKDLAKQMAALHSPEVIFTEEFEILEQSSHILEYVGLSYQYSRWHSQSDIIYSYGNFLFSGDIMINGVFTTALMEADIENTNKRFSNYTYFCNTLINLSKLNDTFFLPGHRAIIKDYKAWAQFYISKAIDRMIRIGKKMYSDNLLPVLETMVPDIKNNCLEAFIRLSEMIFFRDMLANIDILKEILIQVNLYSPFEKQFSMLENEFL